MKVARTSFVAALACLVACDAPAGDVRQRDAAFVGCAHLVEVYLRDHVGRRYVTVDATACAPGTALTLALAVDDGEPAELDLGEADGCATYGGGHGLAADVGDHVLALAPGVTPTDAALVRLLVDGELSDAADLPNEVVPAIDPLPPRPLRRRPDETWEMRQRSTAGCLLFP